MIGRELAGRVLRALAIKGGYELQAAHDLVPTLPAFALEHSPWPPHRPFHGAGNIGAVAGQFSALALWVEPTAPASLRVVLDELVISSTDATGFIARGFVADSAAFILYMRPTLMDVTEDTISPTVGIRPLIQDLGVYTRQGAQLGFAVQTRYIYGPTGSRVVYSPRYPIAILRPGQGFVLETNAANIALNAEYLGRVIAV